MSDRHATPPAVPARISLVTLGCANLQTLTEFYARLGWPQVLPADEGVSFFRLAGALLSLYPEADLAADAMVPIDRGTGQFRTRSTLAINVATPEEVDAALAHAVESGGSMVKPPQKVFWGGYSGYFADPEGNLWEVAHNPFWPLDERGLPVIPDRAE
ncbi:VOC family protein [Actinospica sp. MGRD01-02]|uniref:VOC family protein n=1 Tax=Actinospica acidithermotolerans TaxID=2828514 RepID=A0A941EI65_9ACTN|nr:VOC family protein [Actinospica acidithermotolerans]MBR7828094.1 VOC family protein [Actinospica acidithermotolerans]